MSATTMDTRSDIHRRVDEFDWNELTRQLDTVGHAITPVLLGENECEQLAGLFDEGRFQPTIEMGAPSLR